jgi:DNA-binding MarR family transcriptional regulator
MSATNATILNLPCLCGTLRRTARALTQSYERFLRPLGLRSSQFTILQFLWRAGETTQGALGASLAMDSTSLSRTLAVMLRRKWIAERRGDDRRQRWLRLTTSGEALLNRALPPWTETQARLQSRLGAQAWQNLFQFSNQVTGLVASQEGASK